jgi:hypothetical protein
VTEISSPAKRLDTARAVGFVLGDVDPDFALRWVDTFDREAKQAFALSGVIAGMARGQTNRAAETFSSRIESMQTDYTTNLREQREAGGMTLEETSEGLSSRDAAEVEANSPSPTVGYVTDAAYVVGAAWEENYPLAAIAWVRSISRGSGLRGVGRQTTRPGHGQRTLPCSRPRASQRRRRRGTRMVGSGRTTGKRRKMDEPASEPG